MMQQEKNLGRESLTSIVIYFCIGLTILSSIGINLLEVKVLNIEYIDRGLYSIITEKGNVNVHPEDVLRIERTFSKKSFTGEIIEIDKIYTDKGFIYLNSLAPYAEAGRKLMNSVDYYGISLWEREDVDWESLRKYSYSIGTPLSHIPLIFFLLSLQYAALSIGGVALAILIFPLRLTEDESISLTQYPMEEGNTQAEEEQELQKEVMGTCAK